MSDADERRPATPPPGEGPGPAAGAAELARRREEILAGLVVVEHFLDDASCDRLVDVHRRLGWLRDTSDNGLPLGGLRGSEPEVFALAGDVLGRMQALIRERFRETVACDFALVCALTAGGFRHVLHADNAMVMCPQHGGDAEHLVRVGCACADIRVLPNHTPWRSHSTLLYLSDGHTGGHIVFGDGPNAYGGLYRKELVPTRGLLVLFPSNELYYHHTTTVESGTRYSMNSWFTRDPQHASPDWR